LAPDQDVSFHAIIACQGSHCGSRAICRSPPESTSNAGWVQIASVQDFKPFCTLLAKSSAKPAPRGSELNLVVNPIDRQQVDRWLTQKSHGSSRSAGVKQ
jgi:hypothetical protein